MLEIADIKIFNDKDEPQVVEEMMIKSGFNVQMEQLVKMVPAQEVNMRDPPTPPEMECLGFKFDSFDIFFSKGYVEVAFSYEKVTEPSDPERCEGFLDALRKGPKNAINSANEILGGQSPKEFLEEKKATLEKEYESYNEQYKAA